MPVIKKAESGSVRRRKRSVSIQPEYYYAYVGSGYIEDLKAINTELKARGIVADQWVSCNGMVEYRIKASSLSKCPDLSHYVRSVSGTHSTKGFPYVANGVSLLPLYLYERDSTDYLKDSSNPWVKIAVETTDKPRRRRRVRN